MIPVRPCAPYPSMYSDQPTMPSSVVILRKELTRHPASQWRSSILTIFISCPLQRYIGASPTPKIITSSLPITLKECPAPDVSSTTTTLPTGNLRIMPVLVVISYSPCVVTKIILRGAVCGVSSTQVLGAPIQKLPSVTWNGAVEIVLLIPGAENPSCSSVTSSSKCDSPRSSTTSLVYLAC